jgi:Ca2+-binding RTX toxin-like protein
MANKRGTNGNDIIDGTAKKDKLEGLGGSDILNGFEGNDELIGDDPGAAVGGSDLLNGGLGNDTMGGGKGNDRYIVDSIGDRVLEKLNEGTNDVVDSSVSFTLSANVERLNLTGVADINGTGNTLDNRIIGNAGKNTLNGGNGRDILDGNIGDDILDGGIGNDNDTLDGGLGKDTLRTTGGLDTLRGGADDDLYQVFTSNATVITDTSGIDTVQASVNFTLGAGIENLTLVRAALNGTGNTLSNVITGNGRDNVLDGGVFGDDRLDGGAGADQMNGRFGNDTFVVDNAGDVIVSGLGSGDGIDTVESLINFTLGFEVENLTLLGNAASGTGNADANVITGNELANTLDGGIGDDTLIGNAGDDLLIGNSNNDILSGGAGNDTLNGGAGADTYLFSSNAAFNPADLGVDVISNFNSGVDKIQLDSDTFGAITPADIAIVANDDVAATSSGLVTYSVITGSLFFNQNGAAAGLGTGAQLASINGAPLLSVNDFVIAA